MSQGLPDGPVPTTATTERVADLLDRNWQFGRAVDFPAGLRCHALNLAVSLEARLFDAKDAVEVEARVLQRARVFDAYLRGDGVHGG